MWKETKFVTNIKQLTKLPISAAVVAVQKIIVLIFSKACSVHKQTLFEIINSLHKNVRKTS